MMHISGRPNICSLTMLFFGLVCLLARAEEKKAPVIAVGYVMDRGSLDYRESAAVRGQVVTELIKGYDCRVVGRSRLYFLAVEGALEKLRVINQLSPSNSPPLAADYVVGVRFVDVQKGTGLEGFVAYTDLASTNTEGRRVTFSAHSMDEVPAAAVACIARVLGLRSAETGDREAVDAKHVWAVLPFARFDKKANPEGDDVRLRVEQAVQSARSEDRMVERSEIDKVMAELKIRTVAGMNESETGLLTQLVGADHVVMGSVASCKGGLRLDAHVLDARQGVVLAADSTVCTNLDQLGQAADRVVSGLVKNLPVPQHFKVSDAALRCREADCNFDNVFELATFYTSNHTIPHYNPVAAKMVMENAEAGYVLAQDDPDRVYLAARTMHFLLEDGACVLSTGYPKDLRDRAALLVDRILAPFCDKSVKLAVLPLTGPYTPKPFLLRANALLYLGRKEEALKLVERHFVECENVESDYAKLIKVKCLISLGSVDKAQVLLEEVERRYGSSGFSEICRSELAKNIKDDRVKYELLKNGTMHYRDFPLYLELMQKYETPGAALVLLDKSIRDNDRLFSYGHSAVMYSRALSLLALNRKAEAVLECKHMRMSEDEEFFTWPQTKSKVYRDAGALIDKVEKEIGKVGDPWRQAVEVRKFTENLKVYVYQVGVDRRGIVTAAAKHVEDFLGAKVVVIPIPVPPKVVNDWNVISKQALLDEFQKTVVISNDCIMVAYATAMECATDGAPWKGPWGGSPVVLTSFQPGEPDNPKANATKARSLAKMILTSFYRYYVTDGGRLERRTGLYLCEHFPCIFAAMPEWFAVRYVFAMCPDCQEVYKKVNFDRVHNNLMEYKRKTGL